jgi:hypothetical protein
MMTMTNRTIGVALLACLGCASTAGSKRPGLKEHFAGAPAWVTDCKSQFAGRRSVICDVGMVAGVSDPWLARSAAEGRGRAEIVRILRLRLGTLGKDTGSAVAQGTGEPDRQSSEEQYLQQVVEELADGTVAGIRRETQWVSDTGTIFVLMVLEPEAFLGAVERMHRLDAETRRAIAERASSAFLELERRTSIGEKEGRPQ